MRELLLLLLDLLTAVARLLGRGGAKALVAENLLIKRQLLILTRSRQRAPNLMPRARSLLGFWSLFLRPTRFQKVAVAFRPATLLAFRQCLVRRKYRALFSFSRRGKPGPKGPSQELVRAIVELKRRNPRFGCPRIALIIARTFGVEIDKEHPVTSAPTMIHCSSITAGRRTFGSLTSRKSRPPPTFRYLIPLSSASLGRSGGSFSIRPCSGIPLISKASCWSFATTTIANAFTVELEALHPAKPLGR